MYNRHVVIGHTIDINEFKSRLPDEKRHFSERTLHDMWLADQLVEIVACSGFDGVGKQN